MKIALARLLIERSRRPSPVITTGELLASVGPAGIQAALESTWLVPDLDSGALMINLNGGKLDEIREACVCASCSSSTCSCAESSPQGSDQAMPLSMREAWAGIGIGSGSSTPTSSPAVPRPQPTSPTSPGPKAAPQIGDDVLVADEGESYTGKVASVGHDGRYRLSFASKKPRMDREYSPNEIRPVTSAA